MSVALRLTLAVTLLTYVAISGSRLVFVIHALDLGARSFEAGLLSALSWIFPLLLSWPIGRLCDRHGAYWLLLAGSVSGAGSLVLPHVVPGMPALFIAALLAGLWNALFHVTTQSLIYALSKPQTMARNFVLYSMVGSLTNFSGPVVGGYVLEHAGSGSAFLGLASAPTLAALMLLLWGRRLPGGSAAAPAGQVMATLKDREAWRLVGMSGLTQMSMDLFPFYVPIYGRTLGLSASVMGNVVGVVFVAAFILQSVLPRLVRRFGPPPVLAWAFGIGAVSFLLVPLAGNAWMLGTIAFVFGAAAGCAHPITSMLMSSRGLSAGAAATIGLRLSMNNVLRVAAPSLLGSVGTALGLVPMFVITALLMGCGGVLSRSLARKNQGA